MDDHILFFDTETNGFPSKSTSLKTQPHIVQLAAIMVCTGTRQVVNSMNVVIKPCGWDIPSATVKVHGITKEYAYNHGVSEPVALSLFLAIWNDRKRVSFNNQFDDKIIDLAIRRFAYRVDCEDWSNGESECCMTLATAAMNETKRQSLKKAYQYFIGGAIENQHDAMADTIACMNIYFKIKDSQALAEFG